MDDTDNAPATMVPAVVDSTFHFCKVVRPKRMISREECRANTRIGLNNTRICCCAQRDGTACSSSERVCRICAIHEEGSNAQLATVGDFCEFHRDFPTRRLSQKSLDDQTVLPLSSKTLEQQGIESLARPQARALSEVKPTRVPREQSVESVSEPKRIATDEEVRALVPNMLKLRPRRRQIIEKYLEQGKAKAAESLGIGEVTMGSYISDVCFQLRIPRSRDSEHFDRIGTLRRVFELYKKMVESGEIEPNVARTEYVPSAEDLENFACGVYRLTRREKQIVEAFVKSGDVASVTKELGIATTTVQTQLSQVSLRLGMRPAHRLHPYDRRGILRQALERYEELVKEGVIKIPKWQLPPPPIKPRGTSSEATPEEVGWLRLFPQLNAEDQKRMVRRLRKIISNYKK